MGTGTYNVSSFDGEDRGVKIRNPNAHSGFTLLEVVLAIFITTGMLVVVLYFYQQAAGLRTQLVQETERLAGVRLAMDRLTAELRTARPHPSFPAGLAGSSTSIQFVRTEAPARAAWASATLGRVESAQTDLRLVRYELRAGSPEETNGPAAVASVASGLMRTEEPLAEKRTITELDATVQPEIPSARAPQPLVPGLQYLRFRFWNGSQWSDSWSASTMPQGVEVKMGFEIPEDELAFDDYEFGNFYAGPSNATASASSPAASASPTAAPSTGAQEEVPQVFRRVIFLPGNGVELGEMATASTTTSTNSASSTNASAAPSPAGEAMP